MHQVTNGVYSEGAQREMRRLRTDLRRARALTGRGGEEGVSMAPLPRQGLPVPATVTPTRPPPATDKGGVLDLEDFDG